MKYSILAKGENVSWVMMVLMLRWISMNFQHSLGSEKDGRGLVIWASRCSQGVSLRVTGF